MDKIVKDGFFSAIVSSDFLAPYLERDPYLAEMIQSPDHPDIHYYEKPAPAKEITPALRRRLDIMRAKNITHNLEATAQLVAFMAEHPESEIYNVTFNGRTQHYGVRCAWINGQPHVICVITGARIPEDLLGASSP